MTTEISEPEPQPCPHIAGRAGQLRTADPQISGGRSGRDQNAEASAALRHLCPASGRSANAAHQNSRWGLERRSTYLAWRTRPTGLVAAFYISPPAKMPRSTTLSLEETPDLLRFLAEAGITSREACGNTVRNITACYRAGTSATEAFDVLPYAQALFRFLVRNKYNQNLGRKFKITFEGCAEDHSACEFTTLVYGLSPKLGMAN